jgi:hypothetical protein
LDTEGNIFGGFTPVEWESRVWNGKYGNENNCTKAGDSQKSFLFTLKNSHNIPARTFALKAERRLDRIYCDSRYGPSFPGGLIILDDCNANIKSFTLCLGDCYTNNTGIDGTIFFTGSNHFRVTEIEVFEITD